jgi:signal transduction histidine kinase
MSVEVPSELPPLRRKIGKIFFSVIVIYALLGGFMMGSVFLASGITPKLIHINYDSIQNSARIHQALHSYKHPENFGTQNMKSMEEHQNQLRAQIENAIAAQERAIAEKGEAEVVKEIRSIWNSIQGNLSKLDHSKFLRLHNQLNQLVEINENAMFRLAEESSRLARTVFIWSSFFFVFSLIMVTLLSERLANRLAHPIKSIAEALRGNTNFNRKLKLPAPMSLELKILIQEIGDLWDRLYHYQRLNLDELVAQKEYLYSLLSSVDDGILVLDPDQKVVYASAGMLEILGTDNDSVCGHSWLDLSVGSLNYLKLRDLLKSSLPETNAIELLHQNKIQYFAARSKAVHTSEKKLIGTLYLLHNISVQRQKERVKGEYLNVLAHELRAPLKSLTLAAENLVLKRQSLSHDVQTLGDMIFENAARIQALSNDFSQVALADLRALRMNLKKEKLSELIPKWISPFSILAKDKGIKIEFQREGSDIIWANVDSSKLPWAFSNLIENAIRVSDAGSEITVFMTDRSHYAEIEIHDQGPGITEEVRKHLFEPQLQYIDSHSAPQSSMGFGLTIAKEIVKAHQGQIEYFSRKPYGSIFRISLPYIVVFEN